VNALDGNRETVVVIGGGITGLAAAHRVRELAPQTRVVLLEAGPQVGGALRSVREEGYLLEAGADNFITNVPWAIDLCRRLGIEDQLIPTHATERRALVVRAGRLQPVPEGFFLMAPGRLWPVLASPILSWWGKLRLLAEPFVPRRRSNDDESVAAFASRRLGVEAFERLVQPLVGGIYTADTAHLSLAATLPRFIEMEQRHGGLVRAALATRRHDEASGDSGGARYGLFVTPRDGLQTLVDALVRRLPPEAVQLNAAVECVAPGARRRWRIDIAGQPTLEADGLIVALPAAGAARILRAVDPALANELAQITSAGSVVVQAGYRREQIRDALDGFGFVVPEVERRRILAASYSSQKFPGRAPAGRVLLRVFLGGAARPDAVDLPEAELKQVVGEELGQLLGLHGEPELFHVIRWPAAMPQYHLGHCARVGRIERQTSHWPAFALAGNAYHGVGIPNCIHSGEQAAERVLAHG
jgi:protoporphyrinogen/coproporphyrinogen III oxidase